ncbi:hypothetical protein AgCh_031132 [Apium graveolens]
MSKSTRRATIRAICEEIVEEFKTPAVHRSRKASNVKKVSTVQRVYSTRRSARLTEQSNVESIPVEQKEEKIVLLVAELSKIDMVDVTDDKSVSVIDIEIVLQEPLMKSDAEALEIVSNIKDNEFNDQKTNSEKILKVVDELNTVQVCLTNSLMIENENENVGSVKEEIVNELEEKVELLAEEKVICESLVIKNQDQEYAMDTENDLDNENDREEQSEELFDTLDESHFVHEVIVHNIEIEEKTEKENDRIPLTPFFLFFLKGKDEQQLDNVDSYSDKSADSKQRFSDASTYPWDALPINELDDKMASSSSGRTFTGPVAPVIPPVPVQIPAKIPPSKIPQEPALPAPE